MKQNIPELFLRKMRMDNAVKIVASEDVVLFDNYKRIKQLQRAALRECEKWHFPSKFKGKV